MKKHILFSLISSLAFAVQATHAAAPRQEHLDFRLLGYANIGHAEGVQNSIDDGANVNAQDHNKWTALMWAAHRGGPAAQVLLAYEEIYVNAQDQYGTTALMFAAMHGHANTVQTLFAAGADPTITNDKGENAADMAEDDEIKEMLREAVREWTELSKVRTKAAGKR